ncbi:MAG: DUF7134 domain-containing protein [Ornithinimicrobium sp.]|uniref:DUF7134 domain-containing protein n=1 Tax=Ornithinimicrobium sp. TaxID=1977084 RepID=UPI003D9AF9C4
MERLERLAGADTGWQRPEPTPEQRHADVGTAVGFLLVTALGVELLRSMGALSQSNGVAEQYAAVVSAALLLVFRRSHPLPVAAGAAAHLLVCSTLVPSVVATLPMQILYFVAIYSGVAWARERRSVPYVVLSIVAVTYAWFAWWFALSSGIQELSGNLAEEQVGLLPPLTGAVLFVLLNNVLFFTGATVLGQVAWRGRMTPPRSSNRPTPSRCRVRGCATRPWSRSGCASHASCTTSWPTTSPSWGSRLPPPGVCCGANPRWPRRR